MQRVTGSVVGELTESDLAYAAAHGQQDPRAWAQERAAAPGDPGRLALLHGVAGVAGDPGGRISGDPGGEDGAEGDPGTAAAAPGGVRRPGRGQGVGQPGAGLQPGQTGSPGLRDKGAVGHGGPPGGQAEGTAAKPKRLSLAEENRRLFAEQDRIRELWRQQSQPKK
jgi:hypothetical protein